MQALAQEKRNKTTEEIKHIAAVAIKQWRVIELEFKKEYNCDSLPDKILEHLLKGVYDTCQDLGFTLENFWFIQRQIIHHIHGDPRLMAQSNGLRQHAIPYWNPTHHRLNVAPLGLVESVDEKTREAKFVEFVNPGDQVWIPAGYTTGGRYSSVAGVAPQLRPLPRQVDDSLDLAPIAYSEWCAYTNNSMSECCRKIAAWHEKGHKLVCSKCGNSVRGKSETALDGLLLRLGYCEKLK